MSRRASLSLATLAIVTVFALVAPSGVFAATTIGQTFIPTQAGSCDGVPEQEVIQTGRTDGISYSMPSAGVLTSWSFQAAGQTTLTVRAFHPTGTPHQYRVIADGGPLQTVGPNSFNSFPTRIPVEAGDFIGIRSTSGTCRSAPAVGDTFDFRVGTSTPFGMNGDFMSGINAVYDIAARLEPDCDGDGLGDESQDTNVSSCAQTGKRAAALKKCKSTAKKKHWSTKRLKKCKRKARLLPV